MKLPVQIDFQILDSSVDPKEISEIIGVQPDTALRKGERNRSLGLPKGNIWAKRSVAQTPDAFLEDHWAALAPAFRGKEAILRQAARGGKIRMTLIVDGTGRFPPLIIPKEMIAFAAAIGAEIDIDVYQ
jgi:Domain of unknown function (DUF4279)